jgi:hypothetical protein
VAATHGAVGVGADPGVAARDVQRGGLALARHNLRTHTHKHITYARGAAMAAPSGTLRTSAERLLGYRWGSGARDMTFPRPRSCALQP